MLRVPAAAGPDVSGARDPGPTPVCPGCKRPLDQKGRCWRCSYRLCSRCGQDTGSAFIELCIRCGLQEGKGD
jgi:hypothetical protein